MLHPLRLWQVGNSHYTIPAVNALGTSIWSGRWDLNPRSHAPKACALSHYATPRKMPRERIELSTQGFSLKFSWITPRIGLSHPQKFGVGRLCEVIVGAHSLVSTPSKKFDPSWLGSGLPAKACFAKFRRASPNSPDF